MSTYTPDQNTLPDGAALTRLVDGDAVNADNLVVEVSPGVTKKMTLGLAYDMVTSVWAKGGSIKVAAYSGTIWTIAAGLLETFLHALADKAAKVDATLTTFSGSSGVTINNALQAGSATVVGLTSAQGGVTVGNPSHTACAMKLGQGAYISRTAQTISSSATTATVDASFPLWIANTWHHASNSIIVTISDYAGSDNPEIEIVFDPTDTTNDAMQINRSGPATLVVMKGGSWSRFRWNGAHWQWIGGGSGEVDGTKFLAVTT